MEPIYNEENIEQIERYLNGDLSDEEKVAFEQQMKKDVNFRQLVQQHQLLEEGIQWAAYQEEKEKLREIHQAIVAENKESPTAKVVPFNINRFSRIAAVFLVGVLLGLSALLFQKTRTPPIAQDTDATEENYGGVADGLPLLEATVPLIKMTQDSAGWQQQTNDIGVVISKSKYAGFQYKWQDAMLQIFIKEVPPVSNWNTTGITVILQQWEAPKLSVALLQIDTFTYQIPLTDDDFKAIAKML